MKEVQDYLRTQGAVQAACLDGGASVSMYHQGALVNSVNIKEENRLLPMPSLSNNTDAYQSRTAIIGKIDAPGLATNYHHLKPLTKTVSNHHYLQDRIKHAG